MKGSLTLLLASVLSLSSFGYAQQYAGDYINNTLPPVGNTEIAFFRIPDPAGKNNNLTLINYYGRGRDGNRIVESNIQRAVIVIHGLNRDPFTYESNALSALNQVTNPDINFDTVAVISPYFPNGDDKNVGYPWTTGLPAGQGSTTNALVWPGSQWSAGGNAQYPYTVKNTISSFYVLDTLVKYFDNATLFPNIKQIVVAGHSLGAQTVHRYAVIGNQLNTRSPVTYWVGNPNSYIWMDTSRPFDTTQCAIYDTYRDGFTNFTQYPMTYATALVAKGRPAIIDNFNTKQMAYARGTADQGDDSTNCAPATTGANRNERFFNFIKKFPLQCQDPKSRNCDTVDLINVGHDSGQMMASPAGQARLYTDNFYGNNTRAYDMGYPRVQDGDDPFPDPTLNSTKAPWDNGTYAGKMTYYGCYSDQQPLTLSYFAYDNSSNSVEFCTQTCNSLGYSMAGVEYSSQCYCGNALAAKAQRTVEASCNMACAGNSNETCGGIARMNLYSRGTPKQLTQPVNVASIGTYKYTACYVEVPERILNDAQLYDTNNMSVEACYNYCKGYKYFGLEYGQECYCGNAIGGKANATVETDCNFVCTGNNLELCGAGNRMSLYSNSSSPIVSSSSIASTSSIAATSSVAATSSIAATTSIVVTSKATSTSSILTTTSAVTTSSIQTTSSVVTTSSTIPTSSKVTSAIPSATPAVCPQSNNTVIATNGQNFLVECNYDHYGGDLGYVDAKDLQACIVACSTTKSCIDVSLSGTACYMKSSLGPGSYNGNVHGAKFIGLVGAAVSSSVQSSTLATSTVVATSSVAPTTSSVAATSSAPPAVTSSSAGPVVISTSSAAPVVVSSSSSAPVAVSSSSPAPVVVSSSAVSSAPATAATPSAVSCPASNNTLVTTFNGASWYIECGMDHYGGDLGLIYRDTFFGCITGCANTTSCIDVAYTGTACYMKSAIGANNMNGVWGARLYASPPAVSSSAVTSTSSVATTSSIPAAVKPSTSSSAVVTSSSAVTTSSVYATSSIATTSSAPATSSIVTTSSVPSTSSVVPTSSSTTLKTSTTAAVVISSAASTTSSAVLTSSTTTTSATPSCVSGVACPTLSAGFTYAGCFQDGGDRVMPINNGSSNAMTPQKCASNCRAQGFKYSGTEYSSECYCSNYLPAKTAPDADCNSQCSGDAKQNCGGGYRLSVVGDSTWKQTLYARQSFQTWNLTGCYADDVNNRALANIVPMAGGAQNATIANCLSACAAAGYKYCGAEYYSECYGASVAPKNALLGAGSGALAAGCDFPCAANSTEACGGSSKITIYINNA